MDTRNFCGIKSRYTKLTPHYPMSNTIASMPDDIATVLREHLTPQLLLSIRDALTSGATRAHASVNLRHKGHMASAVSQIRHFHMNEAFHRALEENGASPTPPSGNTIVTARAGILTTARLNTTHNPLASARRSSSRRLLAKANDVIGRLAQPDLFECRAPVTAATVFFIATFADYKSALPASLHIAVPDKNIRHWLFMEELDNFINSYTEQPMAQPDLAVPRIKRSAAARQRKKGT